MTSSKLGEKSGNTLRGASYSNEEDRLLCHVYLDVSQDSITGIYQSREQFWSHIESEYHRKLATHINNVRPKRSLAKRMQTMLNDVSKLRGCLRQIENLNPSGALEHDLLDRAKILLAQNPKYKKGFKFDHVWPLLKDMKKFANNISTQVPSSRKRSICNEVSHSDSNKSDKSIGSSFCIDLNTDFESEDLFNDNNDALECPIGKKKEKMKKKQREKMKQFFKFMKEENEKIKEMFEQNNVSLQQTQSLLQKNYELQLVRAQIEAKKVELQERREENKILLKNVDSIKDSALRDHIKNEQRRIMIKRDREQESQGGVGSSNGVFEQRFTDFGGNGVNLSDY